MKIKKLKHLPSSGTPWTSWIPYRQHLTQAHHLSPKPLERPLFKISCFIKYGTVVFFRLGRVSGTTKIPCYKTIQLYFSIKGRDGFSFVMSFTLIFLFYPIEMETSVLKEGK